MEIPKMMKINRLTNQLLLLLQLLPVDLFSWPIFQTSLQIRLSP